MLCFILLAAAVIPIKLEVEPSHLSYHQRLRTVVSVKIDGAELARRRGKGELKIEMEIRDQQGRKYTSSQPIDLREVTPETRKADIYYSNEALVMPGDYTFSAHVLATTTGDTGRAEKTFHVAALDGDPLPDAWRNMPTVEFLPDADGIERWFRPGLSGHLNLSAPTRRPVKIDLLMNVTPSELGTTAGSMQSMNMAALLPTLKALASTEFPNGTLDLTLLDIAKQRVIYTQQHLRELDWPKLKDAFAEGDPNKIDIQALATRSGSGTFFLHQISRRVEASAAPGEPLRVIVVLSGPMAFREEAGLHPIEVSRSENCKVFYFRFQPAFYSSLAPVDRIGRGIRRGGGKGPRPDMPPRYARDYEDALASTLRPLGPRLFQVYTPMHFRKALADLFLELARM